MSVDNFEINVEDLLTLDLEYKLTVAYRINCQCAPYLIDRRTILIPEVIKQAKEQKLEPIDIFVKFVKGLHARHSDIPLKII